MAVFYIDISSYQAGINLRGWHAVAIKATQGTYYTDSYWNGFRTQAASVGAFSFGYHFLEAGNGAGQADHYVTAVGRTPAMIDFEPTTGSNPSVGDAEAFCDRLRSHGCACNLVYLPRWYWGNMRSPSLEPLASRGLKLVSSDYVSYSDSGPGWSPYGGMVPEIWQYTSTLRTGGQGQVDCNAFKGTFAQLQEMVTGVTPPPPHSPPPAGDIIVPDCAGRTAGAAHNLLAASHATPTAMAGQMPSWICTATTPAGGSDTPVGHDVQIIASEPPTVNYGDKGAWVTLVQTDLNRANAGLAVDADFGAATLAAVDAFQGQHTLTADGIVGPVTWAHLGEL